MNYPFYIARHLSLSTSGKKTAPAVTVAMLAVALSIGVMVASIAIVLGFKKEIKDKVVGFNSHISVFVSPTNSDEGNVLTLSPELSQLLSEVPFIKTYSLQASIPAILKTSDDFKGVYLKGVTDAEGADFICKSLEEGSLADYSKEENNDKIVISRNAARQLKLKTGDKIDTYFISDDVRVRRLEITGIFNSHFDQYDDVLIFGSLELVQKLGQIEKNQGTYLSLTTDNFNRVDEYSYLLQNILNKALATGEIDRLYHVDNVVNQSIGYFSWLALLDTNVAVVLILMMIVGCITLISGMLIIILERKRFIGLMKAIGAPNKKVRSIFVYLALKIAIKGMIFGNFVIIAILLIQHYTHVLPLDADSYYIDYVPVEVSWMPILLLNIGVAAVIYLSLILPSRFVAKISPSETMRYE